MKGTLSIDTLTLSDNTMTNSIIVFSDNIMEKLVLSNLNIISQNDKETKIQLIYV